MLRWLPLCLLLGVVLLPLPAAADKAFVVNRIVAIVDDEPLTWVDVRARVAPLERKLALGGTPVNPQTRAELARKMLATMIDETLIAHAADRARISVSVEDVDRALVAVATTNSLTVAELTAALPREGYTLQEYRADLRRRILELKYLNSFPGDAWNANATPAEQSDWTERRRSAAMSSLREECWVEVRL
jgi:peptidyl-prolyl cis-trans isomerase SurA